jgi:CRP-like cAMP-binding protein
VQLINPVLFSATDAFRNSLLAKLPATEIRRIQLSLKPVFLRLGEVLHECCDEMDFVYFPTTAIVTLYYLTREGYTVGTGMVGHEGILGIEHFMGGDSTTNLATVHSSGRAFRMSANALRFEFAANVAFRDSLLRYTQAMMTQVTQTAVCNRVHSVQQQLARWLLESLDRIEADKLMITHERMAHFLGRRRESVTVEMEKLSELGVVNSVRGIVTILDRDGLELIACECYGVVSEEYARLTGLGVSRTEKRLQWA